MNSPQHYWEMLDNIAGDSWIISTLFFYVDQHSWSMFPRERTPALLVNILKETVFPGKIYHSSSLVNSPGERSYQCKRIFRLPRYQLGHQKNVLRRDWVVTSFMKKWGSKVRPHDLVAAALHLKLSSDCYVTTPAETQPLSRSSRLIWVFRKVILDSNRPVESDWHVNHHHFHHANSATCMWSSKKVHVDQLD